MKKLVLVDDEVDKVFDIVNGSAELYSMFKKMPFPKSKKIVFEKFITEISSFSKSIAAKVEVD